MKSKTFCTIAWAMMIVICPTSLSLANDSGLAASLHELRKERGKLCTVSHYHSGTSEAHKTKRKAIRAAIKSWEDFTAWEYGTDWGKFRNAASKGQRCSKSGKLWDCSVRARPCKRRR